MEQKQNGMHLRKIKQICSIILFLLNFYFCQAQNENIIEKEYKISNFSDKSIEKNGILLFQSIKMANFLGVKSIFFLDKGGRLVENKIAIKEIVSIKNFDDLAIDKRRERFLFITDLDNKIKDTIKISKRYDYSICQLDKKGEKFGVVIGKYQIKNNKNHYFEISLIFSIFKNKLKQEPLNTILYDCPPPNDYINEEEEDFFYFGTKKGKKYSRFWYEN